MNFKKQIKKVVKEIINLNGSVTSLEVKTVMRLRFPNENITQNAVSAGLIMCLDTVPRLDYDDNGTFRTYFRHPKAPKTNKKLGGKLQKKSPPVPSISNKALDKVMSSAYILESVTNIINKLKGSGGRFVTVAFNRKDGTTTAYNGRIKKKEFMSDLGYIQLFLPKGNGRKQFDPKKVVAVSVDGSVYRPK